MSAKTAFFSALVLSLLSVCAARGQYPPAMPSLPEVAPSPAPEAAPPAAVEPPGHLSDWILYGRPAGSCLGPYGGDGPLQTELYLRSGVTVPLAGGVFDDALQVGWGIQGGGRALLFNPGRTAAWAFGIGISNYHNHGKRPDIRIPLNILVPPQEEGGQPPRVFFGVGDVPGVSIRGLNRTFFDLGVGRVWYLFNPATCEGRAWRTGFDVGGRWGSAKADFNEIRHRVDTIGGVWAAWQTDMEIPCGCCIFQAGLRAEWAYTWSDILQVQNNSDLMDASLLLHLGVRF